MARGLRMRRASREIGYAVCWLLSIFILYKLLEALIGVPAVISALCALSVLGAVCVVGFFVARLIPAITLAEAAGVADRGSQLRDELKTAYWFADHATRPPLMNLQLQRACNSLKLIDQRALGIGTHSRGFVALGVLVAVAIALAATPRQYVASKLSRLASVVAAAVFNTGEAVAASRVAGASATKQPDIPTRASSLVKLESGTGVQDTSKSGQLDGRRDKWRGLEELEETKGVSGDRSPSAPAPVAGQILPKQIWEQGAAQSQASGESSPGGPAANPNESMPAILAGAFEKMRDSKRSASEGGGENAITGTAETKEKADDGNDGKAAQAAIGQGGEKPGEGAAAPMSGQMQGEGMEGLGQGTPNAETSPSQGGALPEFATLTTAGGSGTPKVTPGAPIKALHAEVQKDEPKPRLQAPLRRVKLDDPKHDKASGTEDVYLAPTRWQQSALDYGSMASRARQVAQEGIDGERIPLAYRETVKEYFLSLQPNKK